MSSISRKMFCETSLMVSVDGAALGSGAAFGEGLSNAVDFVGFARGSKFVVAVTRKVMRKL